LDAREAKELVKALKALKDSAGWKDLTRIMKAEAVEAALKLGDNPNMTANQMHFCRGAIASTKALLALPDARIHQLENELALMDATASAKTSR
jgi:hypothetical protein